MTFPTARITIKEITERLCISKTAVYDMLNAGMIPAVRLPSAKAGKWIVSREAYMRWEGQIGTAKMTVDKADEFVSHLMQ